MIERVVVIHDFSTAKGGATALALASIRGFRKRGVPVTLLAGDDGVNAELTDLGAIVVSLGQQAARDAPKHQAFLTALYNGGAEKLVARWIAENDTPGTVYHVHNWGQILSPSVLKSLRPVMDRLVMTTHDFFLVCPNGAYAFLKSGKLCPLVPMSAGCVLSNCDRKHYGYKLWRVARQAVRRGVFDIKKTPPLLAIHESMRPYLVRGGAPTEAIRTVPNPVEAYHQTRVTAEDNDEFVFIGRLETTKGPDLAAAAARRAGVRLRMIGDGVLRARLEEEYPEVIFSGRQPSSAIPELVANARALIMPSRYPEPYGLVAMEALWSGLPVIAADTAFLTPDIVAAGAGFGVEPRDEAAMAKAMRTLMDDRELTRTMSINAFENTRNLGMTPDAWIEELLSIYRERLV